MSTDILGQVRTEKRLFAHIVIRIHEYITSVGVQLDVLIARKWLTKMNGELHHEH